MTGTTKTNIADVKHRAKSVMLRFALWTGIARAIAKISLIRIPPKIWCPEHSLCFTCEEEFHEDKWVECKVLLCYDCIEKGCRCRAYYVQFSLMRKIVWILIGLCRWRTRALERHYAPGGLGHAGSIESLTGNTEMSLNASNKLYLLLAKSVSIWASWNWNSVCQDTIVFTNRFSLAHNDWEGAHFSRASWPRWRSE